MPYRSRGQFTAPTTRTGKSFVHDGRRVLIRDGAQFQLTWNGQRVADQVLDAVVRALSNLSDDALAYMQSIVPVDTGLLQSTCFVIIDASTGRIRLVIGADTRYAIYIELGTSRRPATPYIRPTYDYIVRRLPTLIRKEVARRGR